MWSSSTEVISWCVGHRHKNESLYSHASAKKTSLPQSAYAIPEWSDAPEIAVYSLPAVASTCSIIAVVVLFPCEPLTDMRVFEWLIRAPSS